MVIPNARMACLTFHIIPVNTGSVALWNCRPTDGFQTLKKVMQIENKENLYLKLPEHD